MRNKGFARIRWALRHKIQKYEAYNTLYVIMKNSRSFAASFLNINFDMEVRSCAGKDSNLI